MSEEEKLPVIYGDWRDLRRAIELAKPEFKLMSNDDRKPWWEFATAVLVHYAPLIRKDKVTCIGSHHGNMHVIPLSEAYRCTDCDMYMCKPHAIEHFGPDHKRHG